MGNGRGLGQSQYHILNTRARERSAGSSGKLGGWLEHSVLLATLTQHQVLPHMGSIT